MDIIAITSRFQTLLFAPRLDDDFSDRLNYRYTVAILIFFSVILLTRQSSSDSNIKCWVPAHFTKTYDEYVSRICWVSNTYQVDDKENIPKNDEERNKNQIRYYQWVFYILVFQAILFYSPRIFWKTASVRSGLDISDLVEAANRYKSNIDPEIRDKHMKYIVENIHQYVNDPRRYNHNRRLNKIKRFLSSLIPFSGKFLGNYLVNLYFIVKIIFLLNAIIQILLLSALLGYNFINFGVDFLHKIFEGKGWIIESKYFPKSAFCDFSIREPGNPQKQHRYTVQCVLSVNLFNQQIFIIIWFWYLLILITNFIVLIRLTIRSIPSKSAHWIKRRIRLFDEKISLNSKLLQHFINVYLELDGTFMIRLIASNSSEFVAVKVLEVLWNRHEKLYDTLHIKEKIIDFDGNYDNEETKSVNNESLNSLKKNIDFV